MLKRSILFAMMAALSYLFASRPPPTPLMPCPGVQWLSCDYRKAPQSFGVAFVGECRCVEVK